MSNRLNNAFANTSGDIKDQLLSNIDLNDIGSLFSLEPVQLAFLYIINPDVKHKVDAFAKALKISSIEK